MRFPYNSPKESIQGETFRVITYKTFPTTRKETKTTTLLIPSGMYQDAKDLFKEFKFISLKLSAGSRVGLHVPPHTVVMFGGKLKDLLGFSQYTFEQGDYKSEYVLEFSLRRYALPLMMQAGKYLRKRLLESGQNIVEDVSRGKSFRHAARDQIHQSGREIKADIIRKLQGGGGGVKRKKSQRSRQTKRKKRNPTDVFSDL
ncbi:uncharacterized protein TNCV_803011 [Trichonephila clavipes]|nr:uncharacterized protein TNCV_803011 [Trichonephila clavipes]